MTQSLVDELFAEGIYTPPPMTAPATVTVSSVALNKAPTKTMFSFVQSIELVQKQTKFIFLQSIEQPPASSIIITRTNA